MYDTIIIGAGLSGLAAGIRLAYYDKPVVILERHTTIGGLNSFYRLRKRNHDVGLHAVTNYAEPGTKTGPLSKLLRQLRLRWDDFDLSPQVGSKIVFPGHSLTFTNEFEHFQQQIAEEFPSQKDGFERLVQRIREHDELDLAAREFSARQVVGEYLTDPMLIDMIFCPVMFYGSPTPHDMDFNQFVIMFQALFFEGFGRPYQGVRLIMKQLTRKYKELGGELRLRAGVKEIVADGDRTTGVILEDGTLLAGERVVSSAGSAETMKLCEQNNTDPVPHHEPGDISFTETIFSLDCQPTELDHNETIIFYSHNEQFQYVNPSEPADVSSGIICSPNNFQYDKPLDEGTLRITAMANHHFWLNQPTEEEYIAAKERWCEQIITSALQVMPDFRPHIVDTDMFTPRTIKKYTGHLNGCVYGAPHKVRDGRTHLENLYLCGTDQGFLGIIGAMLSGITIANLHLMNP